ncbi:LAGLIDADG family homing endonuclease, partial [Staphylococcus aureus]
KFFEPWAARSGREAGWLAGIYDGEGYLSIKNRRGTQLGVAQKPGVVLSEIERLLKNFGYSNYRYAQTGNAGSGVISLQSQGGFATIAHLLG